jgi:4-alpha-glucanotransferase
MELNRAGGILLHPTSLPSPHGIGDLGSAADHWIDWLSAAGCHLWQILPLVPPGQANSPYSGTSAFAGNPLLISLELLTQDGLLSTSDLDPVPDFPTDAVDFVSVNQYKRPQLAMAASRFYTGEADHLRLGDYALYTALKEMHGEASWSSWDPQYSDRRSEALNSSRWQEDIDQSKFTQFLFFRQRKRLHRRATSAGISIIGDIPIFVAHDSADVWSHPELFQLDEHGNPTVVAGVPPDYFSPTGQRWGNPLYDWEALEANGYDWWINRIEIALRQTDFVRLDHFRGFQAFWEIPRDAPTAETGQWVTGPGSSLFTALQQALGQLPLIAEDLGVITPEVVALRDEFGLPGMRILQFGLEDGPEHPFLPANYIPHSVVYTGTHDNDTSRGWYEARDARGRALAREHLACEDDPEQVAWKMIEAIWSSVANWALAPLQDFLSLDSAARMNFPGTIEGNWSWRATRSQLSDDMADKIHDLNEEHGR